MKKIESIKVERWSNASRFGTPAFAALIVLLGFLPYMIDLSIIRTMTDLLLLIVVSSMWNLLAGYGGMESVGQQAFVGIGAYGLVVIADLFGINVILAVPLAGIVAGVFAYLFSFLAFRLKGGYFAIGTWVIAEVTRLVITQFPEVGMGGGISLGAMAGFQRELRVAVTYWVALAVTVLALLICILLVRSKFGLGLTAVRDDHIAAATSGVDVNRAKRVVLVIASSCTGMAGAIVAMSTMRVQPESVFSVQWAAFMIFIVVVGGVGTLEGPILGAILFWGLRELLSEYGSLYLIILGLIAVVFALFFREGIWGLIQRRRRFSIFPIGYRTKITYSENSK